MTETAKFTAGEADPSWWPRVLEVLARDWPEVNDEAWSRAIGENAERSAPSRARQLREEAIGR